MPFVKADATKFSETGYVGHDVDDIVRDLIRVADNDLELAQYGIVYVDEIDKIATKKSGGNRDVSGRGVQINLLKLMEDTEVSIQSQADLAGQMDKLDKRGMRLVQEGISLYKTYRRDIPKMVPFYPVGTTLIHDSEGFVVAGLKKENHTLAYIVVYRLDGKDSELEIPLEGFAMKDMRAAILYPSERPGSVRKTRRGIKVTLPRKRSARLVCING